MTPKALDSVDGSRWTREEHLLAFRLYCRLPFGKLHHRNPEIVGLARMLGRTPSSVAMKLSNFASLDPALRERGIRGLASASKGVRDVWDEFAVAPENLAFEAARIEGDRIGIRIEEVAEVRDRDLPPSGTEREAMLRIRVGQNFFRRRVLAAYEGRCCVTGLMASELLVASHIVPWSEDVPRRLDVRNGLCLNALHDRAFDRGLMWVDERLAVRFAPRLRDRVAHPSEAVEWLTRFEGRPLLLPEHFAPDPELLRQHRAACGGG